MRQRTKGPAWGIRQHVRDFNFHLDEIRMLTTRFHREQDWNVPIALVRNVIARLPSARLVACENEGHPWRLCSHGAEIAQALGNRS